MTKSQIDKVLIKDLAELLSETNLSEIEVETGGLRIRVARQVTVAAPVSMPVAAPAAAPVAAPVASAPAEVGISKNAVTSPMVGTLYTATEPGADPFIKVGDVVKEGQTLFIIEAMKVMNPIPAPRAGRVTGILVADGDPVEYGEPLLVIE